jgi:predicted acylesterase/phospholipase RssA
VSPLTGFGDSAAEAREQAAVVVRPDTRSIGLLEFHQFSRAREAGRAAGRTVVDALAYGAEPGDVSAHLQEEPVDVVAVDREDRHRCGDDARL